MLNRGLMEAPTLSLVLPIYNEEEIIPELDRRLRGFLAGMETGLGNGVGESWEVIFVNATMGQRTWVAPLLKESSAAAEPRWLRSSLCNFGPASDGKDSRRALDRASGDDGGGDGRRSSGPARKR